MPTQKSKSTYFSPIRIYCAQKCIDRYLYRIIQIRVLLRKYINKYETNIEKNF